MSLYAIQDTTLTAIGEAVRSKSGKEKRVYQFDLTSNDSYTPTKSDVIVLSSKYNKLIFDVVEATNVNPNPAYGAFINFVDVNNVLTPFFVWHNGDDPNHIEMNIQYSEIQFLVYGGSVKFNVSIIPIDENGNEFKYTPLEMAEKINEMATIPESAYTLSGDIGYRYRNNAYNWIIEQVGHKITTNEITSIIYLFANSTLLEEIPFDINCSTKQSHSATEAFNKCYKLKEIPMINNFRPSSSSISNLFADCRLIKNFPEGFGDNWNWQDVNGASYGGLTYLFNNCYSLRQVPESIISNFWSKCTSSYSASYCQTFNYCACLDEIHNLAVQPANLTSNIFASTFHYTMRLKDMTFATNEDGTPQIATWKSQTIDLSTYCGYATSNTATQITGYNSGITADKRVTDAANYEALKNDPDWWTADINYSRYNHDSAVNTINSLPDCSATGTNTIKFKGAAGALTDGGAINTMTEAEIAVAAAKGWTVTLV